MVFVGIAFTIIPHAIDTLPETAILPASAAGLRRVCTNSTLPKTSIKPAAVADCRRVFAMRLLHITQ